MGTVKSTKAKLLVALIIFMIIFSNCGFTLSAIATSDEFQVITNGFFRKDEISFKAYFEDEKGNEVKQITTNVNQKAKLILEILPQVQGYLRTADLKAVSADGSDVNFKITNISYYEDQNSSLEVKQETNLQIDENELNKEGGKTEELENTENLSVDTDTTVENEAIDMTVENEVTNTAENVTTNSIENVEAEDNTVVDELSGKSTISTNTVSGNSNTIGPNVVNEVSNDSLENATTVSSDNIVNNESELSEERGPVEVITQTVEEPATSTEVENNEDALIDEDKVIEEKTEEANEEQLDLPFGMKIISNNEIEVMNIIKGTKLVLDIEYEMGDTLNVEDLMKDIHLQLSGTYINSDLEDVPVAKEDMVTLGWEYTKDVELTSEYTKFSPFEVGDINGTIVENRITVKREVSDEKFLPIKNTKLEVGVPKVNGKLPTEISIIGERLLATRGEDIGYTSFNKDNWSYDPVDGKIQITVENTNLVYASGLDDYVIIYRYEDKIDAENSNLGKDVHLTIEEYSARENHIIEKDLNETQVIKVDVGELVTYSISSTEEKINKAKIYANYNNETPIYETEYTNQINVNILTSDILEELKINCNQELYKDVNGFEFVAEGIEYRRVKFSFFEVSTLLANGGDIVITNEAGEILYTLNKDIIKSEEDCIVNLNGETGIIIYARNIAKNGSLNFEVAKVIKGCNFDRAAFKNFTSIESRITAEVKYQKIDETLGLPAIGASKYFEEASTYARLSLNKETLSTTKSNDNVEIKIELNNDKENSNLYVNPAFEIVFPKYVNDVTIQNLNVLYENGLKVSAVDTFKEQDISKIKIEFEGTQKTFSESSITNGTNIIINANIKVDEYTPKKEDQIKLYYCNEGVSTYESQTKWTISKQIPNGILKTTNGFDVAIIKYQAPSGLVAINGIVNYDGNLSEVKSVKQGEVKEQIETNGSSKIMTMELLALNNTDNKCSDVVLIGRIPFAGVRDVVTNRDLGTTVDTVMKDLIREDMLNTNTVDIYYSTNPEATKDLDNIGNGWTREVGNMSEVKSFLIFVKGAMQPGQVLRYTYDFEIPGNLPYETNIEGSFGAFYNNNSDIAVVYESSVADPVGLRTETGPKLEATLSVDIGDGTEVGECRFLNYTIKVKNVGSVVATDVIVKNPIPNNTLLYIYDTSDLGLGNNNWVEAQMPSDPTWTIETLNPEEEKEFKFMVKTARLQEESEVIVKSKAIVTASNLGIEIESNETSNKVESRNFDLMINTDTLGKLEVGKNIQYKTIAINISGNDLENVKVECKIPKGLRYNETYIAVGDNCIVDKEKITFDEEKNVVTAIVDKVAKDEFINIKFGMTVVNGNSDMEALVGYVSFFTENGSEERTSVVTTDVIGPILNVQQVTNADIVLERQNIEFAILIENVGTGEATGLKIKDIISTYLENVEVRFSGSTNTKVDLKEGNLDCDLKVLPAGSKLVITISGIVSKLPEKTEEITISNQATISGSYIEDITTNLSQIIVKENPEKIDEKKPEEPKFDNVVNQEDNSKNNNSTNNSSNNTNNSNGGSNSNSSNSSNNNLNNNSNSSNNLNNNSSNSSNNTSNNSSKNENINKDTNEMTYSISGKAWIDKNKNGKYDLEEEKMPTVKVQLYKDKSVIKAVTTDGNGEYNFSNLKQGSYIVTFTYNSEKYTVTNYKSKDTTDEFDSDALETSNGSATTNAIVISNNDIANIDLGLKLKDKFDLSIEKYLTKAKVTTNKSMKEYEFDKEKLTKVEIRSKEIEGAKVDLEYTIEIENTGDVQGNALKIVDQMPEDMTFDEKINEGWYLGTDGNVYNESLKDTVIEPGNKVELKLVLTKTMTGENTGTSINKLILQGTSNILNLNEDLENNTSTNAIMILISTGETTLAIWIMIVGILLFLFIYFGRSKINISFSKVYKNNVRRKNKIKKVYK